MEKNVLNPVVRAVLIGGSAGSLDVIMAILSGLRTVNQPPVIIVIHRRAGEESGLSELLGSRTKLVVKEVEEKEPILENTVYIAPADYHLLIEKDLTFSLDYSEKENYSRPSIDITFQTASEAYGKDLLSVLLSGASTDGSNGLVAVKQNGGVVIVQDPSSAQVAFMPEQALTKVKADFILSAGEIAGIINRFSENDARNKSHPGSI